MNCRRIMAILHQDVFLVYGRMGCHCPFWHQLNARWQTVSALVGIRVGESSNDHTRVVFDLSAGAEHQMFTLLLHRGLSTGTRVKVQRLPTTR